jgi:DNA-binding PadR family transcriptional regulator
MCESYRDPGRSPHGRRQRRQRFPEDVFFFGPALARHGVRRGMKARRGDIRTAVLLLLAEEPRNGYQLMQLMEERSEGVWRPSPGSVYPTLQQLEDEGLIASVERDGRRVFELTAEGRALLAKRPADATAPWEQIAGGVGDQTIELGLLVRQIALAAMQVMQAGSESQLAEARRILVEGRRALYRILAGDEAAEA